MPAVGLEALRRVVEEPLGNLAINRNSIVVIERDQLAKPETPGKGGGFVTYSFHQAAVTDDDESAVVDDRVAGPVELRRKCLLRDCHPDRVGEALTERARGGLDPGRETVFRMAGSF